jgi:C_GCAxxG_C_C family probable redox protein
MGGSIFMGSHSELSKELFEKGYNCAQSVFAAFCDETGMELDAALRLSSSFGGGMGRLREVCGAVSGMFMAAGMIYGYSDPADSDAKTEHYERIQHLAARFRGRNGTIICRELLELPEGPDSPVPEERTEAYYVRRPCGDLVLNAADILDEYLRDNPTERRSEECQTRCRWLMGGSYDVHIG